MNIYISGVNHKSTPLKIRENLSFTKNEEIKALEEIKGLSGVEECVLLSTCNRTEVYVYSGASNLDNVLIEKLLCDIKGQDIYSLKKYFYTYSDWKAVRHLFKVACGLDSMVLGEDQILAQVKGAYDFALEAGTSSGVLNTLFREAIATAKRVKTLTGISRNSISIGSLAVKLIVDIFGTQLEDKVALVIGAGKIGSITLKNLIARGIGKVYVTSRTHGTRRDFSDYPCSVQIIDYHDRYKVIDECDIVISSTTSPHYTITKDMLESSITQVRHRVFIDLAVPRDLDDAIKQLRDVSYYNIDDLKVVADDNIDRRLTETTRAEEIIDEAIMEFEKWYSFRQNLSVVKEVQRFTGDILEQKINWATGKLKNADDADREVVRAAITGTVNEILNKLVYSIREYGSKEDITAYFRCLKEVLKGEDNG